MKYQYLTERPTSEDLFTGSGHTKTASALADAILNHPEVRAFGIEGGLGTGKSTIIKLLMEQLDKNPNALQMKYRLVEFDVDQYQSTSTKSALIKIVSKAVLEIPEVKKDTNATEKIEHARDKSLGRILEYDVESKRRLGLPVVLFAASVILFTQNIKGYLVHLVSAINSSSPEQDVLSKAQIFLSVLGNLFKSFKTVEGVLTLSPVFVLCTVAIWYFFSQQGRKANKGFMGHLFKAARGESIKENISINKEVDSFELYTAYNEIIKTLPKDIVFIIVIDNLDRVTPDKVKEAWSDLEVIAGIDHEQVRVLIPFSSKHVAAALDPTFLSNEINDHLPNGIDYISKRLPIIFKAPPVQNAGWRDLFIKYWILAFGSEEGASQISELIEIWRKQDSLITPRKIKKHINSIISTLIANPQIEDINPVFCSAYINAVIENGASMTHLLNSNHLEAKENGDESNIIKNELEAHTVQNKIKATHRLIRKGCDWTECAEQLLQIHYQTSKEHAQIEFMDEPIERAIRLSDHNEILALSKTYGFAYSFRGKLEISDPECTMLLLSKFVQDNKSEDGGVFLNTWFEDINYEFSLLESISHDEDLIEGLSRLKNSGYSVSLNPLRAQVRIIENALKEESNLSFDLTDQLYSIVSKFKAIKTSATKDPLSVVFASLLWPKRDTYKLWKIVDYKIHGEKRDDLVSYLSNNRNYEDGDQSELLSWLLSSHKIAEFNFVSNAKNEIEIESKSLSKYNNIVVFSSMWGSPEVTPILLNHLESLKVEESSSEEISMYLELLIAQVVAAGQINSALPLRTLNRTTQVRLSNYISNKLQSINISDQSLANYICFSPDFQAVIKALGHQVIGSVISKAVGIIIKTKRVAKLHVEPFFTTEYDQVFERANVTPLELLYFSYGWVSTQARKEIEFNEYSTLFIKDAITQKHTMWLLELESLFLSEAAKSGFWEGNIAMPAQNTFQMVEFLISSEKRLSNSGALSKALCDAIADGETLRKVHSNYLAWPKMLVDFCAVNSQNKIKRILRGKFISLGTNIDYQRLLIRIFGDYLELLPLQEPNICERLVTIIESAKDDNLIRWIARQSWDLSNWENEQLEALKAVVSEHPSRNTLGKLEDALMAE